MHKGLKRLKSSTGGTMVTKGRWGLANGPILNLVNLLLSQYKNTITK